MEGCRSLTGGAHTVLPLYPGIMIRRSNECTLGTALALISPQPRARAVSSPKSLGRDDRIVGQWPLQRLASSHGAHPLARESLPSPNILV